MSSNSVRPGSHDPPIQSESQSEFVADENLSSTTSAVASEQIPEPVVIPPLQAGDFADAGLTGWGPAGIYVSSMEDLNLFTGLPWFHTIVIGTTLWRLVLLPFYIQSVRRLALSRDGKIGPSRDALERMAGGPEELENAIMIDLSLVLMPLARLLPVYGGFIGLLNMCHLPVVQMSQSGFWLLPDLLAPASGIFLPAVTFGLLQVQLQVWRNCTDGRWIGLNAFLQGGSPSKFFALAQTQEAVFHLHNTGFIILHAASTFTLLFLPSLPVAILVQVCTFSITSIIKNILFTLPSVRNFFRLPSSSLIKLKDMPRPSMMQTVDWLMSSARNPR